MNLPYSLERNVLIQASPETVFRYFTDSARWASWWGAGSSIDPRPGGKVVIRNPNGIMSSGEVLELDAPQRIVFTYGFDNGKPIPAGSSRVTVHLEDARPGTRLSLTHDLPDATTRDEHVQGWRFQLSLFANVVANEVYKDAAATVEAWCAAWSVEGETERTAAFARIATPEVTFHDRYSVLRGWEDLVAHVGAGHRFMPGMRLQHRGNVRHCQGTVLADWAVVNPNGADVVTGTNVYQFEPDGRIASVTGVANPPNA